MSGQLAQGSKLVAGKERQDAAWEVTGYHVITGENGTKCLYASSVTRAAGSRDIDYSWVDVDGRGRSVIPRLLV